MTRRSTYVLALELVGVGARDGLGDAVLALGVVETRPDRRVEETGCLLSFPVRLANKCQCSAFSHRILPMVLTILAFMILSCIRPES